MFQVSGRSEYLESTPLANLCIPPDVCKKIPQVDPADDCCQQNEKEMTDQ